MLQMLQPLATLSVDLLLRYCLDLYAALGFFL
mgnify:CR=1 FL=1